MEHIPGYDEWKTTQQEEEPDAVCDCCGAGLWEGDYIYDIDGKCICEDCLNDGYRRIL